MWRAAHISKGQSGANDREEDGEEGEDESATITFEAAEEQAWAEIERFLESMEPYELQDLVADLLKAMGYHITWVAPRGKDGGVDIMAHSDPLGTKQPRIKVQVKRRGDRINVDGLRAFMAIVNDHDVGIFVSLGGFTRDAEDYVRNQERRQVTLIDLTRLVELWIEHWPRLSDTARRRLPLTPIYFLTPAV